VQGQDGFQYVSVPESVQERSVEFVAEEAFQTPTWMMDRNILGQINYAGGLDMVRRMQNGILRDLVDPEKIARLLDYEAYAPENEDVYTAVEFLDDVRLEIFSELKNRQNIDPSRRNLQRVMIDRLDYLLNDFERATSFVPERYYLLTPIDGSQSDLRALVREQLEMVASDIKRAQVYSRRYDRATNAHLSDLLIRIDNILDPED
jgi:hypothetical protein